MATCMATCVVTCISKWILTCPPTCILKFSMWTLPTSSKIYISMYVCFLLHNNKLILMTSLQTFYLVVRSKLKQILSSAILTIWIIPNDCRNPLYYFFHGTMGQNLLSVIFFKFCSTVEELNDCYKKVIQKNWNIENAIFAIFINIYYDFDILDTYVELLFLFNNDCLHWNKEGMLSFLEQWEKW